MGITNQLEMLAEPRHGTSSVGSLITVSHSFVPEAILLSQVSVVAVCSAIFLPVLLIALPTFKSDIAVVKTSIKVSRLKHLNL